MIVGNFYKPRADSAVNKRRAASPAVRIRVRVLVFFNKFFLNLKTGDYILVAVLYKSSFIVRNIRSEFALSVNRLNIWNSASSKDLVVVLSESRSDMNDSSSVLS